MSRSTKPSLPTLPRGTIPSPKGVGCPGTTARIGSGRRRSGPRYSPRLTSAPVATCVSHTTLLLCEPVMSGVGIYPTLLVTTITIAASSAWTLRTGGNWRLNR